MRKKQSISVYSCVLLFPGCVYLMITSQYVCSCDVKELIYSSHSFHVLLEHGKHGAMDGRMDRQTDTHVRMMDLLQPKVVL